LVQRFGDRRIKPELTLFALASSRQQSDEHQRRRGLDGHLNAPRAPFRSAARRFHIRERLVVRVSAESKSVK
jgi:hypothetical protein